MFDLVALIQTVGYLGLAGIVFAESGLLIGFFLPGDSLLFTAGLLSSQGYLDIRILIPLLFVAAVLGDSVGYAFGYRLGPKIFTKDNSLFFHRDHLLRSERFFAKHGGKTIVLARFLPFIRTFAPILAGVGRMKYSYFLFYNVIGALLWAVGILMIGYYLGSVIPHLDRYLLPIVVTIILLTSLPGIIQIWRSREMRRKIISYFLNREWRQK